MPKLITSLGFKVETTRLAEETAEYLALIQDKKDLQEKIEKQKDAVIVRMREQKQYSIVLDGVRVQFDRKPEEDKLRVIKSRMKK